MKLSARDICILALLGSFLYVVQVVLAKLPNIEGVSLLILIITLIYGWRALFPITVFIALEFVTFGFGLWSIFYMYAWYILMALVFLLRRVCKDSAWAWALVLGFYGLIFGPLYSLLFLFTGGFAGFLASWINGVVFDVLHCVGNFALTIFLFKPTYKLMKRLTSEKRADIMNG
ncbi:MAG: hypothetical protein Q4C04_04105 [Clostridia bacterium]|nr:hypothetical protein [Clostridia bacterium]